MYHILNITACSNNYIEPPFHNKVCCLLLLKSGFVVLGLGEADDRTPAAPGKVVAASPGGRPDVSHLRRQHQLRSQGRHNQTGTQVL